MKRFALSLLLPATFCLTGCADVKPTVPEGAIVIRGAGATFPNPLYQKWCAEYHTLHPGVVVEYQSVGSGKGVENFLAEAVDFGASDGALTDEQLKQVKRGAQLVPTAGGAITIVYNVPGLVGPLKLERDTYADIFLRKITR